MDIVERSDITGTGNKRMGGGPVGEVKSLPTGTETDCRGEPLTKSEVSSDTDSVVESTVIKKINTTSNTDERIVPNAGVGYIRTLNDVTVLVAVVVLLSKGAYGEKKTCCSKNSKEFDTFHN